MEENQRIKIENLHFSYQQGEEILSGLNFEIDEKTTAVIGQNGAGKTTFVKLLKGLLKPTAGRILYEEKDISAMTVAVIAKNIGMVFQNPNDQIFKNHVLDEVMFGPLQIGMGRQEAAERAHAALDMFELSGRADANPYDLGLSERKLVAIASILAMNTRVVILDEPTIAQDYRGKQLIGRAVHQLRKEGRTVITIIHDMDFVAENFERVIVFAKGKIIMDGTAGEVFSKEDILRAASLEQPNITKLGQKLENSRIFTREEELISHCKEKNSLQ